MEHYCMCLADQEKLARQKEDGMFDCVTDKELQKIKMVCTDCYATQFVGKLTIPDVVWFVYRAIEWHFTKYPDVADNLAWRREAVAEYTKKRYVRSLIKWLVNRC